MIFQLKTRLADVLNYSDVIAKKILRGRAAELKKMKASKRNAFLIESQFLLSDLKIIAKENRRLARSSKGKVSPYPFFHLLSESSNVYSRIFEICQRLQISARIEKFSYYRSVVEFDAFKMEIPVPQVHEELEWLLNQELSDPLLGTIRQIRNFNFSSFHEACHKAFYCLVEVPNKRQDWKDYFLFVESLVGVQESKFAEEIGYALSVPLEAVNLNYRIPSKLAASRFEELSELEFRSRFLINYSELRSISLPRLKAMVGPDLPIKPHKLSGYSDDFSNVVTPKWLKKVTKMKSLSRQAKNLAEKSGLPRLSLKSYRFEKVAADPAELKKIYLWYRDLMKYKSSARQPKGG